MAAPFSVTQAFSLNIAAPVIVSTVVTGLNFGATYAAVVGDHTGSPNVVISTAGVLTPTVGVAPANRLLAVSTAGKAALSYTATAGAPSAVMNITLDDAFAGVGASNTIVKLVNGALGNGYFTLDAFTEATTVGAIAGWLAGANGTTGVATLSATGALSAKFGATLTMVDMGAATFVDGAYVGNVRISLDY
jgi:hypothetical protein